MLISVHLVSPNQARSHLLINEDTTVHNRKRCRHVEI